MTSIFTSIYNKHRFLTILTINTVLYIIGIFVMPIGFETNDDVAMLLFASGKYTGTPESHLVFINYVYGWIVSSLYRLTAQIEWYTLLFVIFQIFSFSIILWNISVKNYKWYLKFCFAIFFLFVEFRMIQLFQFTTTSGIVTLAGIALILNEKKINKLIGLFFVILGSLIRFEAALLLILVVSPLFLTYIVNWKSFFSDKTLLVMAFGLIAVLGFKYVDDKAYQSTSDWRYFKEYNYIRGKINDNPNADKLKKHLPLQLDSMQYKSILSFMPDPKIVDLNKMKEVSLLIKEVSFRSQVQNIVPSLLKYKKILYSLFLIILFIAIFGVKDRVSRFNLIGGFILFLLLLSYISLDANLKYRVFIIAIVGFLFILTQIKYAFSSKLESFTYLTVNTIRIDNFLLILLFVVLFSTFYKNNYRPSQDQKARNKCYKELMYLQDKFLKGNDKKLVSFAGSYCLEFFPPFATSSNFYSQRVAFTGWTTTIPFNNDFYKSHFDFLENYGMIISSYSMKEELGIVIRNIEKNYHVKVKSKIECKTQSFVIVTFKRVADATRVEN